MSITIPTSGMEYTIVPDGNILTPPSGGTTYPGSDVPYAWVSTDISYGDCVQLNNYRINARYRLVNTTITPPTGTIGQPGYNPGGTSYTITYPAWELISQTLTSTSHADSTPGNPFQQSSPYLTATPGTYGTAVAGFVDGSCYDYFKVFDQSESGYLEANGPFDSTPIENEAIPTTPYNPPTEYPIDALTKFIPDTRESVTVNYQLETVYEFFGVEYTSTINITHVVTQSTDNWSSQVKTLVDHSYFAHGVVPQKPDNRAPVTYLSQNDPRFIADTNILATQGNLFLLSEFGWALLLD